jgi:uncharacterized protein DUF262
MPITPTSDTIPLEDLISQIRSGRIRINRSYQRSGKIWPPRAKSFLVESVLLGMPIPRVLLHTLDSPTPPQESELIDGQQRCTILDEFRADGFALTSAVDDPDNLLGKRFSDLSGHQQESFKSYVVPLDRYSGLKPKQIRQVFRRLNYYTAPLNAAEQRHAQFFGELARFVEGQGREWNGTFKQLKAFTKNQFTRRADEQLMAELVDAMLNGISTPTAKSLRAVYKANDNQFASAADFKTRLDRARGAIDQMIELRQNPLTRRHYQVFSLLLALMHAQGALASVRDDLGPSRPVLTQDQVLRSLERLADAVSKKVTTGVYAQFWAASQEKTNVRENRLTRCKYFYRALTGTGRKPTK